MNDNQLKVIRRLLHQNAELSGNENYTAEIIQNALKQTNPDRLVKNIGGNGIAAIYSSEQIGLTVVFRCEMDALPISETIELDHKSKKIGISHKCGHDGHIAIMLGFAQCLAEKPPESGKVVLLFQPAEETGKGARLVLDNDEFQKIVPNPDFVFALHNIPGHPLGQVIVRENTFASASVGLSIDLIGSTSHAAEPHKGRSPALAIAQIIEGLSSASQFHTALHEASKITVIHARLGEVAFGTSPGFGQVMATLRSHSVEVLERLKLVCERLVENIAKAYELDYKILWQEEFPATVNNAKAVRLITDSAKKLNLPIHLLPDPFPWSEDFGHFTDVYTGAMFGLGAGEDHAALHHPTYDFPDELIGTGIAMFEEIMRQIPDSMSL